MKLIHQLELVVVQLPVEVIFDAVTAEVTRSEFRS